MGGPGENHRPVPSHWQTSSQKRHIMLYTSPWSRFELTTSVVIGIDCICCCKSNDHTITATTAPSFLWSVLWIIVYLFALFSLAIVCPLIYDFCLSLWHLQTFICWPTLLISVDYCSISGAWESEWLWSSSSHNKLYTTDIGLPLIPPTRSTLQYIKVSRHLHMVGVSWLIDWFLVF